MDCLFLKKYTDVQQYCNLQYPGSNTVIKAGHYDSFNGCYDNQYVTCNTDSSITMKAKGGHHRSEFRCISEFTTDTTDYKVLKVKTLLNRGSQIRETTVAQIHDNPKKGGINKPLLRIAWIRDRKGTQNHFWAIFKDSFDPNDGKYIYYDLGIFQNDYIEWKISTGNNKVSVYRDGNKKCSHDVSYYSSANIYYKFGIYNQDDGYDDATISYVWFNTK